jgi:hypothetical protein
MTPELITAIIGVGGLAAIIPKIIEGLAAWRSGRARVEKLTNRTLLERLADAERRAQHEADIRRSLEEYAGSLRLMLVGSGLDPQRIPPWPNRPPAGPGK